MSVYKLKQVWSIQLIILTLTAIAFFSFFYYDAYIKTENQYCVGKPFSLWTNNVIALIASATGGHAISQLFRIVAANVGFRYDQQPRHPYAGIIMFFVTVFMTGSQGSVYFGILERTCIDGYGTPFSPHIWIDWIATVPYCFFLVSMMDLDRNEMSLTDLLVQGSGTSAVVALFLTMFTENLLLINTLFIFANFAMTFALGYQQFDSYVSFKTSCDNYERSVEQDLEDHVCSHLRYLVTIAQSKLNCATFLSISFSLFPVAYYLRLIGIIDDDIWHISIVLLNYLSKCLFAILTTDCHIEMLDSSRVLLMEEKKRSEESRMMFLRYVFHEVRVPLNSVSLGVQLLNDSDTISDSDKETVHTIREAIQFMSETLNDVLSIQKIEQGMLQLELKPFRHDDLIRAVLSNFR